MINEGFDFNMDNFPKAGQWNKHYAYDNIGLWDANAWEDKYSSICTLAQWIEAKNHASLRASASSGNFDGRTDGVYDGKTCSLAYPDVVNFWDEKGLFYKCTEMGGTCWVAMIPHAVRAGQERSPQILVVLHDADYKNPNWAMETVEYYQAYNELAARDGRLVLYVVVDGPDSNNRYIDIMQELSAILHLSMDQVYLDVSAVYGSGRRLSDVEGFTYKSVDGRVISNPDEAVERIGDVPVLNITGRWQNRVSLNYRLVMLRKEHPAFDADRHIHSASGRKMADGMLLENKYADPMDPDLLKHWQGMGIRFDSHRKNGEQWLSLAPISAYEEPEKKLPVMLIFQEVRSPFQALLALSCHYEYRDLVAQGQLICLFFALETPDDNDMFLEILQDAAAFLPIDKSRVYVTGHSHNGHFTSEFMRRHHKDIAAVATLGNAHGLLAPAYSDEVLKVTDAMVEQMSAFDVPLVNINAVTENLFINYDIDKQGYKNAVESWQRRCKAFNCPTKSFEEVAATRNSPDIATRMTGVPNDGSFVQYMDGCECYIAEVKNNAGKTHLRLVTIENMLHLPAPQMPELAWDFVRRFARDLETGEVVEIF